MLLNLMTYVLIPAYTLLFIKGSHLFDSNFSVHGNLPSNQLAFLLWGVLVSIYFYVLINRILMRFQEARLESILLKIAILLLFMAVTTPAYRFRFSGVTLTAFNPISHCRKGIPAASKRL